MWYISYFCGTWGEFNGNHQCDGLPLAELWIRTLWCTTLKPPSADRSKWSTFKGGPKYSGRTVPKWSVPFNFEPKFPGFWTEWEEPKPVRSVRLLSIPRQLSRHYSFDQEVVTAFDRYYHYSLPFLMFLCRHLLKDGHLVNLFLQD